MQQLVAHLKCIHVQGLVKIFFEDAIFIPIKWQKYLNHMQACQKIFQRNKFCDNCKNKNFDSNFYRIFRELITGTNL